MSGEKRAKPRQQLLLQVEYENPQGFMSDYLRNLSDGGLLLASELPVGSELALRISFPGLVEPFDVKAVVRWCNPGSDTAEPESGLEFRDVPEEGQAFIRQLLEAASDTRQSTSEPTRIVLLELNDFLREVYGQEVKNWAELDDANLDLVFVDSAEAWRNEVVRSNTLVTVVDLDGTSISASECLRILRQELGSPVPLVMIGSKEVLGDRSFPREEQVFALPKPLDFGSLMQTIRLLGRTVAQGDDAS